MASPIPHLIPMGARLRYERERLGLSQSALATIGGVSKPTQIGYESGSTEFGVHYLARVSQVGVDSTYVLHGERRGAPSERDWLLAANIFLAIDSWARERRKKTTVATRANLAAILYEHFHASGMFDPVSAEKIFKMAS